MNPPLWETWWAAPLAMCLVLTGIHGYLGIHVLMRKVIFVDLAMAQIAALGAACAVLLGYDPHEPSDAVALYLFSLGFSLAGAGVISLVRMKGDRIPHEAFIGIVYASASALAILLLSKSPTEGTQIKYMLVGSLLNVEWPKVGITACIYTAILGLHWVFRRRFFEISRDAEAAEASGIPVRRWDFLFYLLFGVIITSSVSVAGVLLVFSYLVIPAVVAMMFADRTRARVTVAWTVGTLVSIGGMRLSYSGDFPAGPSIVAVFTLVLVAAGALQYVLRHPRPAVALIRVLAGTAVCAGVVGGLTLLQKPSDRHEHEHDSFERLVEDVRSGEISRQLHAVDHLADSRDPHAAEPLIELLRTTSSDALIEHTAHSLGKLGDARAVPALQETARRDLDALLRVELARAILDLKDPSGIGILLEILRKEKGTVAADEAVALLEERTGRRIHPENPEAFELWWRERSAKLRWRSETKQFE